MIDFVKQTALEAGEVLKSKFRKKISVSFKEDASLVTEADLASEKLIVSAISKTYPNDFICSEEGPAHDLRNQAKVGQRVWIIDPLDGTSNYAHGLSYYCVSIGFGRLNESKQVELEGGVVYAPSCNDMYYALKGQGSFKNHERLGNLQNVEGVLTPFAKNFLVTGFYYATGKELSDDIRSFDRIAQQCQTIRRMGAAALDLCLVADGVFDGFWERGLKPWDMAAGVLILTEAGGVVRNYKGQGFSLFEDGMIAGKVGTVDSIQKLL